MKMRVKMIAAVAAVALLGGCYYGLRIHNQKQEEAEELSAQGETILQVNTDDLTGIKITVGDATCTFEKNEDTWTCTEDAALVVDPEALLGAMDDFSDLKSLRTLTDAQDAAEYGLDAPEKAVTLTNADGTQTTVSLGDSNENTGNVYLMLDDRNDVIYTVSSDTGAACTANLLAYALSEDFPEFSSQNVTKLEVAGPDNTYSFEKDDQNWMMEFDNTREQADSDEVETLIDYLAACGYTSLVDYDYQGSDEQAEEYGLETGTTVTITTQSTEGEENHIVLRIGLQDDSGRYYAQEESSGQVHTISTDAGEKILQASAADYRPEEETEAVTELLTEEETD